MEEHYASLEKYHSNSKITCCSCGTKASFTRYVINATGAYIHDTVGRCDREIECGYHKPPRDFFKDNPSDKNFIKPMAQREPKPDVPTYYYNSDLVKQTLRHYQKNFLYCYLANHLGSDKQVSQVFERLQVGTNKNGGTVFWQIDIQNRVRTAKIILYGTNGKRHKDGIPVRWLHKIVPPTENTQICQCFFGEHLLSKFPDAKVAIVESEKSAIVATIYYPEFIWIATGGIGGLGINKCQVLKDREVVLFPDHLCYDKWEHKASNIRALASNVIISDLLRFPNPLDIANLGSGFDIADYLLRKEKTANNISAFSDNTKISVKSENVNNNRIELKQYECNTLTTPPAPTLDQDDNLSISLSQNEGFDQKEIVSKELNIGSLELFLNYSANPMDDPFKKAPELETMQVETMVRALKTGMIHLPSSLNPIKFGHIISTSQNKVLRDKKRKIFGKVKISKPLIEYAKSGISFMQEYSGWNPITHEFFFNCSEVGQLEILIPMLDLDYINKIKIILSSLQNVIAVFISGESICVFFYLGKVLFEDQMHSRLSAFRLYIIQALNAQLESDVWGFNDGCFMLVYDPKVYYNLDASKFIPWEELYKRIRF